MKLLLKLTPLTTLSAGAKELRLNNSQSEIFSKQELKSIARNDGELKGTCSVSDEVAEADTCEL